MAEINEGGPAFPNSHETRGHTGMTVRQYYAGQAAVGMMANPLIMNKVALAAFCESEEAATNVMGGLSAIPFLMADQMIICGDEE